MATMTLDGTEMPLPVVDPDGQEVTALAQGALVDMADGSAVLYHTGTHRLQWAFRWRLLTQANYDTLRTKATGNASMTLKPPDEASDTWTVVGMPNSFRAAVHYIGGSPRYNVDWTLVEVTA